MTPPALHLSGTARIGGQRVFGPVTLDAPAGQWTCLLGPSGVGKSTVLRLLAGLGEGIAFDGRIATGPAALMAQDDLLMPWLDAAENVTLGARLRGERPDRARAGEVLAQVGLATLAGRKPRQLSGGQRQRVALARTLMEDRPVVLLDEPFSALDAATRARMQDLAAALLKGRTVLHVTHDAAEAARLGHRVLLMHGAGLDPIPVPDTPAPRAPDAAATLSFQGRLLRRLMEAA